MDAMPRIDSGEDEAPRASGHRSGYVLVSYRLRNQFYRCRFIVRDGVRETPSDVDI